MTGQSELGSRLFMQSPLNSCIGVRPQGQCGAQRLFHKHAGAPARTLCGSEQGAASVAARTLSSAPMPYWDQNRLH